MTVVRAPDCDAFGCIGLVRCDYCGELIDHPTTRTALIAAGRVRRGDVRGALALIKAATQTPAPTGPVGTSTAATAGANTP